MDLKEVKAILVIVVGLLVIYCFFLIQHERQFDNLVYIAGGIGLVSLISAKAGKGIVWLWYKLAMVLGWINSRILLSLLYFLFLTPLSLLYRLFKKSPLALKSPDKSIYDERNYTYKAEDLDNPW